MDNPLAALEDIGYYVSFWMSESGKWMAAARCLAGECWGLYGASDDAEEDLWVSDDEGGTWTRWGALTPSSLIVRVTDEDVAVLEWAEAGNRVRWVRSGQVFREPATGESSWPLAWDGDTPVWGGPEVPSALIALADWRWVEARTHPDGSSVWYARQSPQPLLLLAVVDGQGVVEEVYGWPNADYVGSLVPMGDGLFAGYRVEGGYVLGIDHLNFLIDLPARTIHPLLGLPDGERGYAEPWRAIPLAAE